MEAPTEPLLWITLVLMLVGLAGSVLPGLPGVPLIFFSALVYAILTDFQYVGTLVVVLLGLFAVIAFAADFVATTYGARKFGASNWGTVGGSIGGIVGALAGGLLFGIGALLGLILGTIGGVFLGEYLRWRRGEHVAEGTQPAPRFGQEDRRRMYRAAGGAFVGYVASAIVQGFLGLLGVIVFVVALF